MRYIFIFFTSICFSLEAGTCFSHSTTNLNESQRPQNNQEPQNNSSLRLCDNNADTDIEFAREFGTAGLPNLNAINARLRNLEEERRRQRREQQQMAQTDLSRQETIALPTNMVEALARLQATSDAIHAQNQPNNQSSQ